MPVDPNKQKVSISYTAEDGIDYSVITSRNHAAAVAGNTSGAGDPPLPSGWRPRLWHGKQINATGRDRKISVVIPTKTSADWQGPAATLTVAPYGVFQNTGVSGERRTQGAPDFDGAATPPNQRVAINYLSDNGNNYRIITNRAHAAAVGATAPGNVPNYPEIWTPRHYGALNPDLTGTDQRVVLVEPNPASAAWNSDAAFSFTVGGVTFNSTGRKQENRTKGAPGYVP